MISVRNFDFHGETPPFHREVIPASGPPGEGGGPCPGAFRIPLMARGPEWYREADAGVAQW